MINIQERKSVDGASDADEFEKATFNKVAWRLIPFLFICYVFAILDRVNVGFAKLQMAPDLQFSDAVYGFGAGIFFLGYFLFEVPSNVILERIGARVWIARIMITWGVISSSFVFTDSLTWGPVAAWLGTTNAEFTFYALRFLLGVAEAGFFPGIILYLTYWFPGPRRGKVIALFFTAVAISNVIGSPISAAIMQYMDGLYDWRGWQWLFLIEGLPSVLIGILVLFVLPNGPRQAKWLSPRARNLVLTRVSQDEDNKQLLGRRHRVVDAFRDRRVWALAAVYYCGSVCFYAINFWMPTIIQEFGIDRQDYVRVGLLSMIPWGVAAVVMVAWGHHSDRTGERRWHAAAGLLVSMVGLLMLSVVKSSPMLSIIALTLITCGLLAWLATFWTLPTAFLSGSAAAAGIAWINSIGNLGGHFGPDLIGRIRTATGGESELAFIALAAIALVGGLTIICLQGTTHTTNITK